MKPLKSALVRSGGIFDFDGKKDRLEEVLLQLEQPDIWENPEVAQSLGQERAQLEAVVEGLSSLASSITESRELLEMAAEEEDADTLASVQADVVNVETELERLEFRRMFSGEMDGSNCFLDIQAG